MAQFEQSEVNKRLQGMFTYLREHGPEENKQSEPTRMITVRLPASIHDALKSEADRYAMTLNQLCINKLLQLLDRKEAAPKEASEMEVEPVEPHTNGQQVAKPR